MKLGIILVLAYSLNSYGGLKDAKTITISGTEATVICQNGNEQKASLTDIRSDLICGTPEITGIRKLELKKQFDFNGYCEHSDQVEAVQIAQNTLERKAKDECFNSGYARMLLVDFTHSVWCKTYFGPHVTASLYFRCTF